MSSIATRSARKTAAMDPTEYSANLVTIISLVQQNKRRGMYREAALYRAYAAIGQEPRYFDADDQQAIEDAYDAYEV